MLDRTVQATIGACLRHICIVPSERESPASHRALILELEAAATGERRQPPANRRPTAGRGSAAART